MAIKLPHLDAIDTPDAILVTHAHTDHAGALELVVGRYSQCPVYATPPTIALTRVLHAHLLCERQAVQRAVA